MVSSPWKMTAVACIVSRSTHVSYTPTWPTLSSSVNSLTCKRYLSDTRAPPPPQLNKWSLQRSISAIVYTRHFRTTEATLPLISWSVIAAADNWKWPISAQETFLTADVFRLCSVYSEYPPWIFVWYFCWLKKCGSGLGKPNTVVGTEPRDELFLIFIIFRFLLRFYKKNIKKNIINGMIQ